MHLNLSDPEGPDIQCKFNRSGLLCGACKTGLGLTLSIGSSRCIKCPRYWPALFLIILVSAVLAGVAVVILMLVLNLTVALQLAFPSYLILLLVVIILVSRHSIRFARLISKRNPVAMPATLILLS